MVETPGAAIDAVRGSEFDIVLCDLNLEDDAVRMIEQIRTVKFRGTIIVITAENSPKRLAEARVAGANEIIGKPYHPAYLASLLAEWLKTPSVDRPIYSTEEEKPGMPELIADFVEEAQRKVIAVEKALETNELTGIRELCLELIGSGAGFGFGPVTDAARDALTALDTSQSKKDAEAPLRRLISICQRLRCGNSVRPIGTWRESA